MRTKNDILNDTRCDIQTKEHKPDAHLWLETRKIEVFCDIRDILEGILGFLATYYEDGITPK